MSDDRTVRVYHYSDPTESIDAVLLAMGVPGPSNDSGATSRNSILMDAIHRWASTALAGAMQNVGGAGNMAAAIQLRKTMFGNLPSRKAGSEETTTCSICLETFKGDEKITRPLCDRHEFHAECLWHWMREHDTCPICRFKSF